MIKMFYHFFFYFIYIFNIRVKRDSFKFFCVIFRFSNTFCVFSRVSKMVLVSAKELIKQLVLQVQAMEGVVDEEKNRITQVLFTVTLNSR